MVGPLVELLRRDDAPRLQLEAAWSLSNIAGGTSAHTRAVVNAGALPPLVALLQAGDQDVRDQAVWALSNVAGDGPALRDAVLATDALPALLTELSERCSPALQRVAAACMRNLVRGAPPPPLPSVRAAVPVLAGLLRCEDAEVLADACWALAHLSRCGEQHIQALAAARVCERLAALLGHAEQAVCYPALRALSRVLAGSHAEMQIALDCGALPALLRLLREPPAPAALRRAACWALSSVADGSLSQIQDLLDAGAAPLLLAQLTAPPDAAADVRKPALYALAYILRRGPLGCVHDLVEKRGCVHALCGVLDAPDLGMVEMALDALQDVLRVGVLRRAPPGEHALNSYARLLRRADGVTTLHRLQSHSHGGVRAKALAILQQFFPAAVIQPDTGLLPTTARRSKRPPARASEPDTQ